MAQEMMELKRHYDVLKEQFDEMQNIHKSVTGNLKRGKGIARDLGKLQDLAENMTKSFINLNPNQEMDDYDLSNIEDLQDALDTIYSDEQDVLQRTQTDQQRKDYQQRSVRSALEGSEVLINLQGERMQKIQELADEIDKTETLKDAQDLSNRLLGEILLVQQQALLLQAQYVRANQSLNYQYADREGAEAPESTRPSEIQKRGAEEFSDKMKQLREDRGWKKSPIKAMPF